MDSLEERVAHLEGRSMEQSVVMTNLSRDIAELRHDMNLRFDAMDARFTAIDSRFTAIDSKLDARLSALDQKISTQFLWLVGLMATGGLTLFAALRH